LQGPVKEPPVNIAWYIKKKHALTGFLLRNAFEDMAKHILLEGMELK